MEDIEIEIQVNVENSTPLVEFLEKSAEFKKEKRQVDEYFTPAHRNFISVKPVKEWLRLRSEEGKDSVTYKNWHYSEEGKSLYADEYETKLEKPDQLRKIFGAIDMKPIATVDKTRRSWVYKEWEVSLDSIKGLGDFVEIEYIGNEKVDPQKTAKEMVAFLKDIGCGRVRRNYVGYPFMILFPDEVEWEEQ